MKVQLKRTDSIIPYDNNPRVNDGAVSAVASSIREFGFRQPIVVDADDVVIVGHTRLKAAQHLALDKVPVHVATDLTDAQKKAYRIADNQTAAIAEWDVDLLPVELQELEALDFDLSLLGFSDTDLARYMNSGGTVGETDPDDVPEPPDDPTTNKGDLWVLGNHRLLCGDSASTADLDRLLDGAPIHLVNTDPPYNVKVEPRSNNAIAAGLSSFSNDAAHKKHHQKFDLKRHPEKSKGTSKKMRAKDRPLENDFVSDEAPSGAFQVRTGQPHPTYRLSLTFQSLAAIAIARGRHCRRLKGDAIDRAFASTTFAPAAATVQSALSPRLDLRCHRWRDHHVRDRLGRGGGRAFQCDRHHPRLRKPAG